MRESHKAGVLDEMEKRMLQRTFRFSETAVSKIMVPLAEVIAIDIATPLSDIFDAAAEAGRSRLRKEHRSHYRNCVSTRLVFDDAQR
mgnify:CR=1 FL=1